MKLLRRSRPPVLPGTVGVVRLDRQTQRLAPRLRPGDIAVIDHLDLDRTSADALVAAGVGAVVNASPSISGRYPNLGPEVLLGAGVPLLDDVGLAVFSRLRDGDRVRLDGDTLYDGERALLSGSPQDAGTVGESMEQARRGLVTQLEAFAANTMQYLLTERDLLLHGVGFPDISTRLESRHAVVVVRGHDYRADLERLSAYVRDYAPVLIGVDGGADALLEAGLTPHLVVGDPDTMSDRALRCGAEVVVHAGADGFAPGLARVQDLAVESVVFPAAGTSEDAALLLADHGGAELIVAVGTHATLEEFLDKGREGMASTFLTRLRVGGKLVDAKGVSRLYRRRITAWSLALLVLAAVLVMVVAVLVSGAGPRVVELATAAWDDVYAFLDGLVRR